MNWLLLSPFIASLILVSIIWILALWDIISSKKIKYIGKLPKVSFIIPVYNAHETINKTLDSLYNQNYPKNKTEFIVYASGENLDKYNLSKYKNLIFLKIQGKIEKATAVNRAAKKSKGDIVFIVDADTTLEKDVLKKIINRFSDKKVGAVTCSRIARYTGFWSVLQNFEYVMTNFILTSYNKLGSTIGIHGCAMAFRKKAFNDIEGLARIPAQDFDAGLRLIEKDYKIICEFRAKSITLSPNFLKWIKQRFRWMRGFTLSIFNHYKIFFTKQFGLFFTIIYSLLGLIFVLTLIINSSFIENIIYFLGLIISFKLPLIAVIALFTGLGGWIIFDKFLLIILYSCLSIPYAIYPYNMKSYLKLPLIFAYSLIYMPLFAFTGVVGVLLAIKDKVQGRKVIEW